MVGDSTERTSSPTRLLPGRKLPPYSYVPGKFPHPTRDPQGHSYQVEEPVAELPAAEAWRQCEPYLWGIDLFNAGYYWEAHESWEAVWHAVGRRGPVAEFLKGLIKLAAAGVKAREGREQGVRRHARRAKELFDELSAELGRRPRYMGLALDSLLAGADRLYADPAAVVDTRDEPVVVVLPVRLEVPAS